MSQTFASDILGYHYRLTKKIYRNIYLVNDTRNDCIKCLKLIDITNENQHLMKGIYRERSILSLLDSPYIVKYQDSFFSSGKLCIVTEYCEGRDLAQKIKQLKSDGIKLPEEKIIHWFSQLLSACHYIHSQNILHRNIKPGNILIKNGILKLGDFGVSRELKESEDASTFIGTPYYMSPEIIKNDKYNSKSDIWSLGCVLYELATYQKPFVGDKIIDIFESIKNDECPSIINLYSKHLNKILKKILEKNPNDRPDAGLLLCEPLIADYAKKLIQMSLKCEETPENMQALLTSLAPINVFFEDDTFGDYDNKSTLKASSSSTLRNAL
ncbi:serine threonine- kinase Nek11 isoform X2 [Brachionus plicatilis]|uniref:non-specific serine/threonine protein kinase n=1 Tax=Brachionus plicatilis TaxID=10195 RepID=A0A3M7PP20_BRAPC|nr:serine threonine- kinase Nek11 isoform X2 [Brachionus plicatilis]